jgi:hypothetical protein
MIVLPTEYDCFTHMITKYKDEDEAKGSMLADFRG